MIRNEIRENKINIFYEYSNNGVTENYFEMLFKLPTNLQQRFFDIIRNKYGIINYDNVRRSINSAIILMMTNEITTKDEIHEIKYLEFNEKMKIIRDDIRYLEEKDHLSNDELKLKQSLIDDLITLIETRRLTN